MREEARKDLAREGGDMFSRHKLVALVTLLLLSASLSFIVARSHQRGSGSAEQPGQQPAIVGAERIGLILEIEGLWSDRLSEEKVRDEFISALRGKVAPQGYGIVAVSGETEAVDKGLDKVLHVGYTEERGHQYRLKHGTYVSDVTLAFNTVFGREFSGTKIICTFKGWHSQAGWGPLFGLSAETGRSVEAGPKQKNAEELLRQDALETFWQKFPDQLPAPLFLENWLAAKETWALERQVRSETDFEPPIVGNMLLMHTSLPVNNFVDSLSLVDSRSGQKLMEFEGCGFAFDEQTIFVVSAGHLYSVDSLSGEVNWETSGMGSRWAWAYNPVYVDLDKEMVFVGWGDELYGVDRLTGEKKWEIRDVRHSLVGRYYYDVAYRGYVLKREFTSQSYTRGTTMAGTGRIQEVYVVYEGGPYMSPTRFRLARIDKATGQKVWETGWAVKPSLRAVTPDSVLVLLSDGTSYALDTETGEIRWGPKDVWVEVASGNTVLAEVPLEEGGRKVYGLNARTGEEIWARKDPLPPLRRAEFRGDTVYEFQRVKGGGGGRGLSLGTHWVIGIPGSPVIGGPIGGGAGSWYLVTARDLKSGEVLWRKAFDLPHERSEVFESGTKYGNYWEYESGTLSYIDFSSGDVKARWDMPQRPDFFTDGEGRIAVVFLAKGYERGELLALHATGSQLWTFESRYLQVGDKYVDRSVEKLLSVYDSQVFATVKMGGQRLLYALDVQSGKILWRRPIKESYKFEGVKEETIFSGEYVDLGKDRRWSYIVFAFDIRDGKEKWNFGLPMMWDPPAGGLTDRDLVNGTIYLQVSDSLDRGWGKPNFILAVDADTGKLKWYYKTDATIRHLLHVENGNILVWTRHGTDRNPVYRLHALAARD